MNRGTDAQEAIDSERNSKCSFERHERYVGRAIVDCFFNG